MRLQRKRHSGRVLPDARGGLCGRRLDASRRGGTCWTRGTSHIPEQLEREMKYEACQCRCVTWMLVQDVQPLALRSPLTMTHCAMGAMLRMANPINSSTDRTITTLMQMQAREARANARVPRCGELRSWWVVRDSLQKRRGR